MTDAKDTRTHAELLKALEDAEDAKRLWQELAQARAATVRRLCTAVLETDGSLVSMPGTVAAVDEVLRRIDELNSNRQALGDAVFKIAELLMPVGSYASARRSPEPVVAAVFDLHDRYLRTLKPLQPDQAKIYRPNDEVNTGTIASPSRPVLQHPGPIYLREGATPSAHHHDVENNRRT